jgi:hypothetical protein
MELDGEGRAYGASRMEPVLSGGTAARTEHQRSRKQIGFYLGHK